MRKNFFFLMVIAALTLALPTQAQTARKAAKAKTFRTSLINKHDALKAKAAMAKATETPFYAEVKAEDALTADKVRKEADTSVGKSFAKWNWAAHATPKFTPQSRKVAKGILVETHKTHPSLNAFDAQRVDGTHGPNRAATVDAHGIITSPDEGETKYYKRSGTAYYPNGQQVYYTDQSGIVTIVEAADGTIYIKDIISQYSNGTYVKGTKAGNTITVASGQPIVYNTQYATTISANWGNYDENSENGWNKVGGDITFTVDEAAGTISLVGSNENLYIGSFWDDDNSFSGYGDYDTVWTLDDDYVPPSEELVELPDGAEVQTWYREQVNATNNGETTVTGTDVKVAFVGSDVYVAGVFTNFPNSWIKGTIEGTTVTFEGGQFLGYYNGSLPIFAYGTDENVLEDFTMTFDADAETLTNANELLANAATDRVYYLQCIASLTLSAEEPAPTQIDVLPYSNDFSSAELLKHFKAIDANADGNIWLPGDGFYGISFADQNDDWLVSPAIKLVAGKKYHFAVDSWVRSSGYPETFEVKAATEATAEALAAGTTVIAEQTISNATSTTFDTEEFTVAETGYYFIGIHNTSEDMWTQYIDNFQIEALPISAPYTGDFSQSGTMDDYAVIDNNGDGKTWAWNETNGAYYTYSQTEKADDYLVLPIKLEANKIYNVIVTANSASTTYPEKFEVKAGQELTAEGLNISVINETTVTSTEATEYEGSFNTTEAGTYYVAIHATSDPDEWRLNIRTLVIEPGAEGNAPVAPQDFTVTPLEGDQLGATISFTAPTTAIDGTELADGDIAKIEVLRDGNVIATLETPAPGEALTVVDDAEDLTVGTHKYQAISYGTEGIGGKTEEVSVFMSATITVPYTADLTDKNTFDVFQILNANNDNLTWTWSSSYNAYYSYSSTTPADDYLISMPISLEAGKSYIVTVSAKAAGSSYPERFEVVAGKEATVEGLNITAIAPTVVNVEDYTDFDGEFSVAESGNYYLAIHAISDADKYRLQVQKLSIEKGAEPTAPAAVTDLSAQPGSEGQELVRLTFTAPATAVNGTALTGDVDVKIYRDDALLVTTTVAAGNPVSYIDAEVVEGNTYTYYVVAANESGDGQKSAKVSAYVGQDEPADVENVLAVANSNNIIFSWDEVKGINGGYINTAEVEYKVWTLAIESGYFGNYLVEDEVVATTVGETTATLDYNTMEGEQRYQYYGVSAATTTGESDPTTNYTYVLLGAPYELPVEESFVGSTLHYVWETNGGLGVDTNSSDGDEVSLKLYNNGQSADVYFIMPKINLASAANPTLTFDARNGVNVGKLQVVGATENGEFSLLGEFNLTDEYQSFSVNLNSIKNGAYAAVGFLANIPTESVNQYEDYLLLDNIKVLDLLAYNLVADITAPKNVTAGKEVPVKISVRNMGENVAEGYTVKLLAGEKEIELEGEAVAIPQFDTVEFSGTFAPTVFDEAGTVTLRAEVAYELDLDEDDNIVETDIQVNDPAAVAPETLTAKADGQKAKLDWTIAEASVEEITEDFESYEPFTIEGWGEWTTKTFTGGVTGTIWENYNHPHANEAFAFIVTNWESVGIHSSEGFELPHSGDQALSNVYAFENEEYLNNDNWLISPELPGIAQTMKFWAKSTTDEYGGLETYEVYYSTTDTEVESFTKIADVEAPLEWTEFSVELPAGTKFFAIRNTTSGDYAYVGMLDDITFTVGSSEITAFNIYVDEVLVGSVEAGVLTYTTDVLPEGEHKVSVTALYGQNESRPVDAFVTISAPTAIDQIINVDKLVDIFTVDGKMVRHNANSVKDLKPGVYVIDNQKVTVK